MELERLEMLIGFDNIQKLKDSSVAIFGIGGVGGYVAEALARSGISNFLLVDKDIVSKSNINRQIIALNSTLGRFKAEVMKERILDINPNANIEIRNEFYNKDNYSSFDLSKYDYIADCIDTISSKILLIEEAKKNDIKIISAMGAGNKMNPSMLEVKDINQTSVCPLARKIRYELKKRNIKNVKVVYSKEEPLEPKFIPSDNEFKLPPGSNSFMPSSMGLLMASEIIKDIINYK